MVGVVTRGGVVALLPLDLVLACVVVYLFVPRHSSSSKLMHRSHRECNTFPDQPRPPLTHLSPRQLNKKAKIKRQNKFILYQETRLFTDISFVILSVFTNIDQRWHQMKLDGLDLCVSRLELLWKAGCWRVTKYFPDLEVKKREKWRAGM